MDARDLWLRLTPDGVDADLARSTATFTDDALRSALAANAEPPARLAACWVEARRRGLPLPAPEGFRDQLATWPDLSLREAVGPFLRDYDLPRRAALLAEVERRGLDVTAPPPGPPSAALALLGVAFIGPTIFVVVVVAVASRFSGDARVTLASLVLTPLLAWAAARWVRPWFQHRAG